MSILILMSIFIILSYMCSASLLIGIVTRESVLLSSNNVFSKNGVAMREDYDWIKQLGEDCLVGVQGDSSDCDFLLSQLESANRDHMMTFGRSAPCRSIAHLCRRIIAQFLRSKQLKVSVLIAGWNYHTDRPSLFWLDSIGMISLIYNEGALMNFMDTIIQIYFWTTKTGAIQEVPYAAHGDGFSFVLGLLDRHNRISELPITNADLDGTETHLKAVDDASVVNVEFNGEVASDATLLSSTVQPFPRVQRNHITGSLLRMTTDEGVAMIRSCMDSARKRTLSCLGSYRIKGVSRSGCKDLGLN